MGCVLAYMKMSSILNPMRLDKLLICQIGHRCRINQRSVHVEEDCIYDDLLWWHDCQVFLGDKWGFWEDMGETVCSFLFFFLSACTQISLVKYMVTMEGQRLCG